MLDVEDRPGRNADTFAGNLDRKGFATLYSISKSPQLCDELRRV